MKMVGIEFDSLKTTYRWALHSERRGGSHHQYLWKQDQLRLVCRMELVLAGKSVFLLLQDFGMDEVQNFQGLHVLQVRLRIVPKQT